MNFKMFLLTIIFFNSNIFSSSLENKVESFFSYRENISVLVKSMTMKKIDFSRHLHNNEDQKEVFEEGAGLLADIINLKDKKAAKRFRMLAGLPDHELVQNALKNISIDDIKELEEVNPILGLLEIVKQK